jgi:glycine/D-amino acid oxidase-like deaminating enzyme
MGKSASLSNGNTFDVIIIGGGFLGVSTAYHLSKQGASVLLLEGRDISSGTSGACAGRAQVNEGHLDPLNISMIIGGLEIFETLEEELDMDFEWQRMGYLCLINSEQLWKSWEERAAILTPAGIVTEVLDKKSTQEAEPSLKLDGYIGAAYAVEGLLNPFRFCWAYANAARRHGAVILNHSPVTSMEVQGDRVVSVEVKGKHYYGEKVAVMCGAWTPQVTRLAGIEVPIKHSHAEAFITEPLPLVLNNTFGLADFYEIIHSTPQAVAIGAGQTKSGTLLVTESVEATEELHGRTSVWGITGMAAELMRVFPAIQHTRVARSWGRPTSYTPDENPLIGWRPPLDNFFTASSMMETITTVPLVSQWMADMLLEKELTVSMDQFAPERFM